MYLPTDSPDFNPIELWWADLKRQLRRHAPRALAELARTVRRLRSRSSPHGSATASASFSSTAFRVKARTASNARFLLPWSFGRMLKRRKRERQKARESRWRHHSTTSACPPSCRP
ncbi:transposase [Myxococcus sp. Y35]|uniref:transposase n=1 Tax=Pseudomyxococcus flavus TaxID=3115648 RepID=UPI003CEE5FF5